MEILLMGKWEHLCLWEEMLCYEPAVLLLVTKGDPYVVNMWTMGLYMQVDPRGNTYNFRIQKNLRRICCQTQFSYYCVF